MKQKNNTCGDTVKSYLMTSCDLSTGDLVPIFFPQIEAHRPSLKHFLVSFQDLLDIHGDAQMLADELIGLLECGALALVMFLDPHVSSEILKSIYTFTFE